MIFLYRICYWILFVLKRLSRSEKLQRFEAFLTDKYNLFTYYFSLLLNKKYPEYFSNHPVKYGLNTKKRKERYTVSMTSFPTRIEYVHIAIETLMRQSFKADNIVLWLALEQFPDKVIPQSLERLKAKGLTVKFCDDLRSHKKYYYAFKEYPDDNIILIDDDMFYPLDLIKKLVSQHKKLPKDIICTNAMIIAPTLTSLPTEWEFTKNSGDFNSRTDLQAFTGGGTLFPPYWYPEEIFNLESIKKYAFSADDLWLKAMSIIADVKTTRLKKYRPFNIDIKIHNNETLFSVNKSGGENLNNKTWQTLIETYNISDRR